MWLIFMLTTWAIVIGMMIWSIALLIAKEGTSEGE